ncbi:hypothetical protein BegalDRAFT_1263 [Beggiatoa alba B18LD]|uniref:DUF4139 domain-containing protein n=1 Tax=Beggiatoa alba B18LD TaxID=395493 RepID=I3CEW7_9GAMM|nr:hypothetical protein [Beggiatoa alba]EIJ42160.1 hypothetical protein BegalDRAFT_1263 [Beggiatoa alba B18LD]
MRVSKKIGMTLLLLGLASAPTAWARIKLVALPEREATVVRLDNPYATLLAEERVLTLQAGTNQVDFSWKGVEIQPDSIRLTVLDAPQAVKVLSVSYPPSEPALVWEIASPAGQQVRVRINYLLNYIDRLVTYQAVVNKEETALNLASFLVLRNFSGENLQTTRFLLDYGTAFESSVQTGETKRIQFFDAPALPIQKRFTFDANVLPWNPKEVGDNVGIPVHYELSNTADKGLGKHALWDGKARVFSDDGHNSTIFLGEDNADFTPVGQILRLTTGQSRDVVVTQKKMKEVITNEKRNDHNQVVLHDLDTDMQVEIENFKAQPARLTLREPMPQEWEMLANSHPYERKHNQEITFDVEIPAKGKTLVTYNYRQRNIQR